MKMARSTSSSITCGVCSGILLTAALALANPAGALSQARARTQSNLVLFGDVSIKTKDGAATTESVTVVLYGTSESNAGELGRQTVSNRGRFRFANLREGDYELAVEVENREIGRVRQVTLRGLSNSPYGFQYDLSLTWDPVASTRSVPGTLSAADVYVRSKANQSIFQKAQEAAEKKKYAEAEGLLRQLVESDKADFQALTILGTIYLMQERQGEAEKAYLMALELKPTFSMALLNLGRLRSKQKKFAEAIDPLTKGLEVQPQSAELNLMLGEAYLQLKKGSLAVPYLNEAARLGRPEARLRLGWLYNAAGLKHMAAAEYEQFLKQKPDYSDRKKLEEYISANKKG